MERFERRDRIDICKDILIESITLSIEKGATKSYIMKAAGLSFPQTNSYLKLLIDRKLLKKENGIYIITQKALKFLESYHNIELLLKEEKS